VRAGVREIDRSRKAALDQQDAERAGAGLGEQPLLNRLDSFLKAFWSSSVPILCSICAMRVSIQARQHTGSVLIISASVAVVLFDAHQFQERPCGAD
jgi:hypothetical protein